MNRISASVPRLRRARNRRGWGFALLIAALAGCGSSTEVSEVPEAARKTLVRKKVDVQPGSSPPRPSRR